jgi:hypothetical protein
MFKSENTGMPAWKRVMDEEENYIANLTELYNGEWAITQKNGLGWIVDKRFSSPSSAATWLWKNRLDIGEPFSLYIDKEKPPKVKVVEQLTVGEEPSEDLFWSYKK